jgi:hypothetical protein
MTGFGVWPGAHSSAHVLGEMSGWPFSVSVGTARITGLRRVAPIASGVTSSDRMTDTPAGDHQASFG